ncbi:MAG: hypothetical protein WC211_02125 [Dehalococcoidia bacterium]
MERLVVCGWEHDESALLQALREQAQLETVAVGDQYPARLVRARTATRLACYQHPRQMARDQAFEALLLGAPEAAEEVATTAAVRGADLLLLGDRMDADALHAASTAAVRYGTALAVLRPALRTAGLSFVTDLVAADPRWTPSLLTLDVADERPAPLLLRDALALVLHMSEGTPLEVVASAAGDDETPSTIAVHLRGPEGALTTIIVRGLLDPTMRLRADTANGTIELDATEDESHVALTSLQGERERTTLRNGDTLAAEARRVARIRHGEPLDARHALREVAVLRAVEESLASGQPVAVGEPSMRSILRLLAGGEHPSPRRGRLHVVEAIGS